MQQQKIFLDVSVKELVCQIEIYSIQVNFVLNYLYRPKTQKKKFKIF